MNLDLKTHDAAVVEDAWFACMRRGDFERAWRIADRSVEERAGTTCWHLPRHLQYLWDGRPLQDRRVLVHCYHGLGDTVQFVRYVPLLKAIAREVLVWAQPALHPLLRTVKGIDALLALHDGGPGVEREADVEVMELAHVFRSTVTTLPREVPYLQVEGVRTSTLNTSGRPGPLNVGIVWRSGTWDDRRSVSLEALVPLLSTPGVHWVVLQNDANAAVPQLERGTFLGEHTIETAARTMQSLDLVITVDTLAAHLAGALAVPTWTLLHADPDWRWMLNREDSPWYPTMRLFRQTRAGDWTNVIANVTTCLRGEIQRRAAAAEVTE